LGLVLVLKKATLCFGKENTKSLEVIYYEEIFIKLLQFFIFSALVFGSYYFIKKIKKQKPLKIEWLLFFIPALLRRAKKRAKNQTAKL